MKHAIIEDILLEALSLVWQVVINVKFGVLDCKYQPRMIQGKNAKMNPIT